MLEKEKHFELIPGQQSVELMERFLEVWRKLFGVLLLLVIVLVGADRHQHKTKAVFAILKSKTKPRSHSSVRLSFRTVYRLQQ